MSKINQEEEISNAVSQYEVTAKDLPLHCPVKGTASWNSHPKVYLPIEENGGHAKCPYCGTDFKMKT